MTIEEKRRELFEAWYLLKYYEGEKQCGLDWLVREPCGGYRFDHPARHWETFNAALDAVVIELPISNFPDGCGDIYEAIEIDSMREAIESTGLGLKIK